MKKTDRQPQKKPTAQYPDWWKKQFVNNVDLLIQSGLSPDEAYIKYADDLHAPDFPVSAGDIPRLYQIFKRDLAVLAELEKRLMAEPRGGSGIVMVHHVGTVKGPIPSTKQIRTNKAILEAELRLSNRTAIVFTESVEALPAGEELHTITRLDPEIAKSIGTIAQRESNKILRHRWEREGDRFALGAALASGAPQQWARDAVLDAVRRGLHIPTVGSGKTRTTADEEKRIQATQRQQARRKLDREAAEKLDVELQRHRLRLAGLRLPSADQARLWAAEEDRILQEAIAGPDPAKKRVAEKHLQKKSKAAARTRNKQKIKSSTP